MKRLLFFLLVILLVCNEAFAQRSTIYNQDIRFTAGARMPMADSDADGGEIMSITYGNYNRSGFGFRCGAEWMFSNVDIDDYLGMPLSVSWKRGKRTTVKESMLSGAENMAWGVASNYRYGSTPDAGTAFGSFLAGLFNGIEFFAGLTPGYVFGDSETSHVLTDGYAGEDIERYYYIKNRFTLSADAGIGISVRIWRFDLSVIPAFHYFITDNYHEVKVTSSPIATGSHISDKSYPWQFSIQGGLGFSF